MKLSVSDVEKSILDYWKKNNTFLKSIEQRSEDRAFVFYDGPPFATGLPHQGSLLASVIKDLIPRYKTMRGFRVERVWGWDCHGLPIENMVEKELGLNSKKDIEELGVDKFTNACRASVLKYDTEWRHYVDRVGRWVDFENQYKTMDNTFIESVWWGFQELNKKGYVYEGRHISLYCPRCSTPLSNFEIAMDNSYEDVIDHGTWVKFPVKGEDKTFFLSWATTPWTLPGNVSLAVDANAEYARVSQNGEQLYVAKDLVEKVLGKDATVEEIMKGSKLVGKVYEPLFSYLPTEGHEAYKVFAGDFVSLEDGTGIVHTAAIYGEDDYALAQKENLPRIPTLDESGRFLDFVTPFKSLFFKDAEQPIVDDLQKRGLLYKDEDYKHSYPFCWRCATPLYYNAVQAWFIKIDGKLKKKMLKLNEKINWYPEHLKEGRFRYGIENAPDWNISRNRYWGSPIPMWICDQCQDKDPIGSMKELSEKSGVPQEKITDLHIPAIDQYTWPCDKKGCSGTKKRVSQVFDCWVESGSMPFASVHYPFENKEQFEKNFPGEFIAEYIAQTRGWFYTLHVLSTAIFDKPSFVNAVTTGTILAKDGKKISKSKKNYTDPLKLFDQYGADAFRFYLMASPVMQGENLNFFDDGVKDVYRKVIMLLGNIHSLYAMYASTGHVQPTEKELKKLSLTPLDRWLLARWFEVHKDVTDQLDQYNVVKPARLLMEFINDFSTWYLRRSRDRFKGTDQDDKHVALSVTRYVLEQLLLVLAPYIPFQAESLYQSLFPGMNDSIHLKDWPKAVKSFQSQDIIDDMAKVRVIVELGHAARAEAGIRVRQALEELQVSLDKPLPAEYSALIAEEVNVKRVMIVDAVATGKGFAQKEGLQIKVALKTELSEELLMEGLSRELVRQINNLRKQAGMSIGDRALVHYQTDSDFVLAALEKHEGDIKQQTLTDALLPEPVRADAQSTLTFHDHTITIGVVQA